MNQGEATAANQHQSEAAAARNQSEAAAAPSPRPTCEAALLKRGLSVSAGADIAEGAQPPLQCK